LILHQCHESADIAILLELSADEVCNSSNAWSFLLFLQIQDRRDLCKLAIGERLDLALPDLFLALVEGGELFFGKNPRQILPQAGPADEAARLCDHRLLPLLRAKHPARPEIERGAKGL
jgi:hypothetical protein